VALAFLSYAGAQMPDMTMKTTARPAEVMAVPRYKGLAPGTEGAIQHEVWTKAMGHEL
jgi:hypothetical protein